MASTDAFHCSARKVPGSTVKERGHGRGRTGWPIYDSIMPLMGRSDGPPGPNQIAIKLEK